MSEVAAQEAPGRALAVISGPSFALEVAKELPTAVVVASADHAVAEAYGVWGNKSMYGRTYYGIVRSAFLIDEKGRVAAAWYKVAPADTVPEALTALSPRSPSPGTGRRAPRTGR